MVVLPHIPEEREDEIWDSVKTALTELIEQDLGKTGKGKEVVEGGGSGVKWWRWRSSQIGCRTLWGWEEGESGHGGHS